jgi:hypothetical protein
LPVIVSRPTQIFYQFLVGGLSRQPTGINALTQVEDGFAGLIIIEYSCVSAGYQQDPTAQRRSDWAKGKSTHR